MKILQVAAEHYGLIKTGGLADMVASLSATLTRLDVDICVCLPGYSAALSALKNTVNKGTVHVYQHEFNVIQGEISESNHTIVLLDCPELFDRDGDPYRDADGEEFADNGWRFGCFNAAVAQLAARGIGGWRPDLVHLHDWHTGLVPALLTHNRAKVKTLFTIHNFSFHGIFNRDLFDALGLPEKWWHPEELEFYNQFSFMKAALKYADVITAVSPRYAEEIATSEFGCGLEGVVRQQANRLHGIVNGIDEHEWDPAADKLIAKRFSPRTVKQGKKANKTALQAQLELPVADLPLVIFIGRLADQKGADLLLAARKQLTQLPVQLVVLGCGDKWQEEAFRDWATEAPEQVATVIDINEKIAHLLTAAGDLQLLPSRFEPCGLSQMYAQRYGTLPIARATGGLADTITDATSQNIMAGSATGFLFREATVEDLVTALHSALATLNDDRTTYKMRQQAMAQDFSWTLSAQAYLDLYQALVPSKALLSKAVQ